MTVLNWFSAINGKMDNKAIDTKVTSGSSNLITSGAVYNAINAATGFQCTISFLKVNSGGDVTISTTSRYSRSETVLAAYKITSIKESTAISYPLGAGNIFLTNGPSKKVLSFSTTYNPASLTITLTPEMVSNYIGYSAVGTGIVRISGYFSGSFTPSMNNDMPCFDLHFTDGILSSVVSKIYCSSVDSTTSPLEVKMYYINDFVIVN